MADSKSNKTDKPVVKKPNKVTWPTKEEAIKMTKIVIVVVLATAIFLGVVDFVFSRLVGLLLG